MLVDDTFITCGVFCEAGEFIIYTYKMQGFEVELQDLITIQRQMTFWVKSTASKGQIYRMVPF